MPLGPNSTSQTGLEHFVNPSDMGYFAVSDAFIINDLPSFVLFGVLTLTLAQRASSLWLMALASLSKFSPHALQLQRFALFPGVKCAVFEGVIDRKSQRLVG